MQISHVTQDLWKNGKKTSCTKKSVEKYYEKEVHSSHKNFYIILFWCIIPRLFSMLYGERFESADDQKKIEGNNVSQENFVSVETLFQNPDTEKKAILF